MENLFAHPARAAACVYIVLLSVVALFSGINLAVRTPERPRRQAPCRRHPPQPGGGRTARVYDRRGIATIDGDAVRYLGLILLIVGGGLRVGPMFVLGRRFTYPLATQEPHPLMTTGFYRFIRHPSYLGGLLGMVGWVLVFRSGVGLVLGLLLIPVFIGVIRAEEELLRAEFGEQYAAYQRRTWRLIPFVYSGADHEKAIEGRSR